MANSSNVSESEFLKQQAVVAKAAMARLRAELKEDLSSAADPASWTKQYPWTALGAALVGGIATGSYLKRGSRKSKAASEPSDRRYRASAEPPRQGLMESALQGLVDLLKTSLHSALVAAISTKAAKSSAEDDDPTQASGEQEHAVAGAATGASFIHQP